MGIMIACCWAALSLLLLGAALNPYIRINLLLPPRFLVCMFAAAFILRLRNSRKPALALPPGPPSLPIIGHLHLLGTLPHRSLQNLARTHGPLMGLQLGSIPVIVASTADTAREILQTHDLNFASRPRTAAAVYCLFDGLDIAFAPSGPYWRLMRQICVADLLSKTRLDGFRPMRAEEMLLLVQSVYADSELGKQVDVLSKVAHTANNIISRMALGKRFVELSNTCHDPSKNIVNLIAEMHYLLGVFNVGDFIPFLQWMDFQGYVKRMKRVGKSLNYLLKEVIDARREQRKVDNSSPNDLLNVLLSILQNNGRLDVPMTDDSIKAVLMNMFAAGTDTSSTTVEWALAELLRHPTIMKMLQDELERVVGRERLVVEEDIAKLPYLQAVVKETTRLHPAGPLLIPHESIKECRVAGYQIPAKTRAYVNAWAIGRDANAWEDPLKFWPERFVGSEVDVRGKHFQLLPFGSGRRGCPGLALGLLNMQIMLGSLVHAFNWELPKLVNGCKLEVDMCEKFGIILTKETPLVAMATPRLPLHLYSVCSM